ncbi:MAG TPA: hypothetical protein VLT57_19760 [Bryobacteraceae bacterium]|nr:hypothetical protein [Bryobacteraceae bacterium]
MSNTRQQAHQLIDRMPEAQLSGLVQFLETIIDPVAAALRNAPLDDEPETEEEKAAVTEARTWLKNNGGKGIPHAEAMRRLGLEIEWTEMAR